jgi:8-oxo-dGTP pyrophosphatase MutT (NUDIX family)
VRELREELGIEATVGAPWQRLTIDDDEVAAELNVWLVREWQRDVINAAPDEHSELRWCDADDVSKLRLAHPAVRTLALDALDASGHDAP